MKSIRWQFKYLDINMGCPAPKVVKNGDGSALMRNPKLAGQVLDQVVKNSKKPVTLKIRKGWDDNSINALEIAKIAEDCGICAITIHGRTREQYYSGQADWDIIGEVKSQISIPVIGNGDVTSVEDAIRIKDHTGCDAIMIGRGAQGNPWIFKRIDHYMKTGQLLDQPSKDEKIDVAIKHMGLAIKEHGEYVAVREMRKHIGWYLKGMKNSARFRDQINHMETAKEVIETLNQYRNNNDQGICELSYPGLIKRYVTAHFANNRPMIDMVLKNEVEAYNFPQGVIAHLYRQAAGGKDFEITRIGLKTYCDPRLRGGKVNDAAKEDLVDLIEIDGKEYLKYKVPSYDIGIIRGTSADEFGNISMEEESSIIDSLDVAMAVKASGGKVIVQVKNVVSSQSMNRQDVVIPGVFVDAIVKSEDPINYHRQTPGVYYDPIIAGRYKSDKYGFKPLYLNERKLIARRAVLELEDNSVVNLGIGIPEAVSSVAAEEGLENIILTVESGLIGGIPLGGSNFGSAVNSWAGLAMARQFDFYNSGGLKKTFLGFAEMDPRGNINVSRFGDRIGGCGGFIDITQSTKDIVFCGTMTAGGLVTEVRDGKLVIVQEGKRKKFKKIIDEITFSAEESFENGQNVIFVTERCVFALREDGIELIEIAPGVDLDKDILGQMDFRPMIAEYLKVMDLRIYQEGLMGIK